MIVDVDLIAYDFMTDFNGPSRHFPAPFYPTGVYEEDKNEYKFGPESNEYPTLTLPCDLFDQDGNKIQQGFYSVALSFNMGFLNLYQSNTLKARVRVIKLVEKMYNDSEAKEETEIKGRMIKAKENKKLKKYRKAQEELTALKQQQQAESKAEILDSGKGYYILNYSHNGKTAVGIIQK